MGQRWVTSDGWDVQLVDVAGRPAFRAAWQGGWYTGYCYTVDDLKSLLMHEFSDLTEQPDRVEDELDATEPELEASRVSKTHEGHEGLRLRH